MLLSRISESVKAALRGRIGSSLKRGVTEHNCRVSSTPEHVLCGRKREAKAMQSPWTKLKEPGEKNQNDISRDHPVGYRAWWHQPQ